MILYDHLDVNSEGNLTIGGVDTTALAKKYGTNEDASFINGVLGTIAKA